jgi:cysteine desulfurase
VAVYLDHAASSPLHPDALAAMQEWLAHGYGNPSGSHAVARRAKAVMEDAREVVAAFLGVEAGGVVFTSGGTEADNLAVLGALAAGPRTGAVAVSAVEHPAILASARAASSAGHEMRVIAVGPGGLVDLDHLRQVIDRDVVLVSVQTVNQETGVIQPLADLARRVRKWAPEAVIHTDAVQAAPWMDLSVVTAETDLVSISGHKIGGPQGIGALGIRHARSVAPILHGGGQERERRSGTPNVAAIAGLAAAVRVRAANAAAEAETVGARRDLLMELIRAAVPDTVVTAVDSPRSPGHCHFRFPGVENESLLFLLDQQGVCASAGAACASGAIEPSPVLLAMGVDKVEALSSLRLTLGPTTTDDDVRRAASAVAEAITTLRAG